MENKNCSIVLGPVRTPWPNHNHTAHQSLCPASIAKVSTTSRHSTSRLTHSQTPAHHLGPLRTPAPQAPDKDSDNDSSTSRQRPYPLHKLQAPIGTVCVPPHPLLEAHNTRVKLLAMWCAGKRSPWGQERRPFHPQVTGWVLLFYF